MTIERLEQIQPSNKIQSDRSVRSQSTISISVQKNITYLPASQVKLSTSAQYLDIDTSKDIDINLVKNIQDAIADGSFIIDSDEIAKQLLATLVELS